MSLASHGGLGTLTGQAARAMYLLRDGVGMLKRRNSMPEMLCSLSAPSPVTVSLSVGDEDVLHRIILFHVHGLMILLLISFKEVIFIMHSYQTFFGLN